MSTHFSAQMLSFELRTKVYVELSLQRYYSIWSNKTTYITKETEALPEIIYG